MLPHEKIKVYTDKYPLLKLRKTILFIFRYTSYICEKIVKSKKFEFFSLIFILTNSAFLALEDPLSSDSNTWLDASEDYFLYIYTSEMLIKIFGLGFVLKEGSYLRDAWNILDFVIVFSAYLPLLFAGFSGSGINLSILRSFRVLRPLRTISSIKHLRLILIALGSAVSLLINTLIILLFFFLIFAIAGL